MAPFTKAHIPNSNGLEPYPAPVPRESTAISTTNDAGTSRLVNEGERQMRRITEAKPRRRDLTDVERSKFIEAMHGKSERCEPCYKRKEGACLRDPAKPYEACLRCIEKDREHLCKFKKSPESHSPDLPPLSTQTEEYFEHRETALRIRQDATNLDPRLQPRSSLPDKRLTLSKDAISTVDRADLSNWHQNLLASLIRSPSPEPSLNSQIESVYNTLSQHLPSDLIVPVTDFLTEVLSPETAPVGDMRATVIHVPKTDTPYPLVMWVEGDRAENILIAKAIPGHGVYSHIIHRSIDTGRVGLQRRKSLISWNLCAADDLQELLAAVCSALDILIKLDPERTKRLFDSKTTKVSEEELLEYAVVLLPVYYRVRKFEIQLERGGKFWVETFSERRIVEDKDGNKHNVLHHIIEL